MVTTLSNSSPLSTFISVFVLPVLTLLGIYTPSDPTYGRYLLPLSNWERELESETGVQARMRRIFLDERGKNHEREAEDIYLTREELTRAKRREWVYYKIWERTDLGVDTKGKGCDVLTLHGINDYGGKWAAHIRGLLAKGFRVIAPDLPSHGHSTGLHSYIESPAQLLNALEAVIGDIQDVKPNAAERKIFLIGSSMGGGLALSYCMQSLQGSRIAGIYAMAPMIGVAPETMPHPITQFVARIISPILGRLPLANAVRGNSHNDPRVEAEFLADPRGYHGKLRISTGFALLRCMINMMPPPPTFRTPYRIVHGTSDRVTAYQRSVSFVTACKVDPDRLKDDQELVLFEGYEHVMLKVGVDEKDDEMRMRVLKDLEQWVLERT